MRHLQLLAEPAVTTQNKPVSTNNRCLYNFRHTRLLRQTDWR